MIHKYTHRLDQFLTFVEAANNGGHAGALCLAGNVHVNGVAESRRGRKLFAGDEVNWGCSCIYVN